MKTRLKCLETSVATRECSNTQNTVRYALEIKLPSHITLIINPEDTSFISNLIKSNYILIAKFHSRCLQDFGSRCRPMTRPTAWESPKYQAFGPQSVLNNQMATCQSRSLWCRFVSYPWVRIVCSTLWCDSGTVPSHPFICPLSRMGLLCGREEWRVLASLQTVSVPIDNVQTMRLLYVVFASHVPQPLSCCSPFWAASTSCHLNRSDSLRVHDNSSSLLQSATSKSPSLPAHLWVVSYSPQPST